MQANQYIPTPEQFEAILNDSGGYIEEFRLPDFDPDDESADQWLTMVHTDDPFSCSITNLKQLATTSPAPKALEFVQRIAVFRGLPADFWVVH